MLPSYFEFLFQFFSSPLDHSMWALVIMRQKTFTCCAMEIDLLPTNYIAKSRLCYRF